MTSADIARLEGQLPSGDEPFRVELECRRRHRRGYFKMPLPAETYDPVTADDINEFLESFYPPLTAALLSYLH